MVASFPIALIAEFLGTFLLMVTILASGGHPLMIGAALALIVYLTGGISGAAVNPALALGLWYNGSLSRDYAVGYVVVEALAAVAAVWAYKVVA